MAKGFDGRAATHASSVSGLDSLTILAGPEVLEEVRDAGLSSERILALVGASGGPKWLALHGLDRVMMPWLLAASRPLHVLGSSIGAWRNLCLALADPSAAIQRFGEAYLEQRYPPKPTAADVDRQAERILNVILDGADPRDIVGHRQVRMHIVTTRFRHMGAREGLLHKLTLAGAFLANAAHRRALSGYIERVVFDAGGDKGPFAPWGTFPTRHVELAANNLLPALRASAAIPLVMTGVVDPPGAPRGTYRDGGVADYHFANEIDAADGITLYPHFYDRLTPGWFDKALPYRRTRGLRRVLLVAPSPAFVAQLPYGRIPSRDDFVKFDDAQRIAAWRQVLTAGQAMGDAFGELVTRGGLGDRVLPLP